jgi:hypothetical protein
MVEESGMKHNDRLEDISILSTQRKRNLASWALPDTILKVCMCIGSYVTDWLYNNAVSATKIVIIFVAKLIEVNSAVQLPIVVSIYGSYDIL